MMEKHDCGSSRVLRGGSWNNNENNLQSDNPNTNNPDNENNNIGFRVAAHDFRIPASNASCGHRRGAEVGVLS